MLEDRGRYLNKGESFFYGPKSLKFLERQAYAQSVTIREETAKTESWVSDSQAWAGLPGGRPVD
jgi:hypothetical protein